MTPVSWAGRQFPALPGENTAADELLVRFKPGAAADSILAQIAPGAAVRAIGNLNIRHVKLPPGLVAAVTALLAQHPLVDFVEPNRIRRVNLDPANDPSYAQQWDLQVVQAVQAWSLMPSRYLTSSTAGSARIKVAVIDTGGDCTHPDFANAGGTSTDAALGGQLSFADSRAFVATTIATPACPWLDDHGHGTHVGGTVAAATNNALGVASLGYPLELIYYKVTNSQGSATDSDLAQAIMAGADAGATIESISLGGPGYSQTLQDAIEYAWERNTLCVVAAGNTGDSSLVFPASANYALAVAATDSANNRASFSSTGDAVDIAAPGVNILSLAPSYPGVTLNIMNYATLSGTSMATPHVSALAGLIAMTTPKLAVAAIAQRIQQSADSSIANGGWDQYLGYGIIDAARAIGGNLRPAALGGIVGQVVDGSALPITGATLTAGGQNVMTASTGLFRFPNLSPGTYALTVAAAGNPTRIVNVAVSPGADVTVTVAMGITTGTFTGTVTSGGVPLAGVVVEALTGGLIKGTAVSDTNGSYSLAVPPGTYDLIASGVSKSGSTIPGRTVAANGSSLVNFDVPRLGAIAGIVRNSGGSPAANAQVTISGNGFTAGAVTDSGGNYNAIGLTSGIYSAVATAAGQPSAYVDGIQVSSGTNSVVNLQLANVAPVPVAVTPNAASGTAQTFTLTYSDGNGYSDLFYAYLLVNSALDPANSCYIYYWRAGNGFYLVNDSGSGATGPLTPGTAGTLQNSQCVLNGSTSSASGTGATLTLAVSLTFKPAVTGSKNLYMAAVDMEGLVGGWLNRGSYTVTNGSNSPPTADSITPNSGSGSSQTFQAVYSDPNGSGDLAWVEVLVNSSLSGANGCWVAYNRPSNSLYLINDAATVVTGPAAVGAAGTLQNSQCTVDAGRSSVTTSGNSLTLNLALTFNTTFAGVKTLYLLAIDNAGLMSNWQNRGTWNVGGSSQPPTADSVTPNTGSGLSQSFTFNYSSANGAGYLNDVYVLFNGTFKTTNACWVFYDRGLGGFLLVNDTATAIAGPLTPGANATIQNSQCTLSGIGSSVSAAGNTLSMTLNLSFNQSFAGTQTMFMYAADNAGLGSGWQNRGSWTVP